MKRVIAILLALVMVFALVACGDKQEDTKPSDNGGNTDTQSPADNQGGDDAQTPADDDNAGTPAGGKAYPNANEDGSINLERIAHYDREYDYTQNESFKFYYMANESGSLYQEANQAYEKWCALFNVEYMGFFSSAGDSDLFLTTLQNYIDQGVDAFVLDPDNTIFPSIINMMKNYPDVQWMSHMSPPRDGATGDGIPSGGNIVRPVVGFDHYDAGRQQAIKLDEWRKANIPDAKWEEIGLVSIDYSASPPLHSRVAGAEDYWKSVIGSDTLDNFLSVDAISNGINIQAGIDVMTPVISANGQYKYWLIAGNVDDWAQGAATVISQQGLTDNTCITTFGGSALIKQWDAGQQDAFRYALFTSNNLYAEPILGALYAFKQGWTTPEEIWPAWINYNDCGGEGHSYPSLRLPTVWLEPDTYRNYLAWADLYAGTNLYNYDVQVDINDFSPFVDQVPAEYAKQA